MCLRMKLNEIIKFTLKKNFNDLYDFDDEIKQNVGYLDKKSIFSSFTHFRHHLSFSFLAHYFFTN